MLLLCCLIGTGCTEETFTENVSPGSEGEPFGLSYAPVMNAREYAQIRTAPPTINTGGVIPHFEILNVKNGEGILLDEIYLADVQIMNAGSKTLPLEEENYYVNTAGDTVKEVNGQDLRNVGTIVIANKNKFGIGDYYFSFKVTTVVDNQATETIFEDAFHLNVGPQLVSALIYIPKSQNLLFGEEANTTEPVMPSGNQDVSFELVNYSDTLVIDVSTGAISLADGYTSATGFDTLHPQVNVVSNISGEVVAFKDVVTLVASNTPVVFPKDSIKFFYPTFQAENAQYGYKKIVNDPGLVSSWNIWKQISPAPLAEVDRPIENSSQKALSTNLVVSGKSTPFDSWVITNTQSLNNYNLGYNLSATFYYQNKYVEYMANGQTPTELEFYISTDYMGSFEDATWTKVNDVLNCWINTHDGGATIGTPYPGDQKGEDPEGRKNTSYNADGKWVKCVLDLMPYKNEANFTIAFRVKCNFDSEIVYKNGEGRAGTYNVSDLYYMAVEQ
ncbi:hypothetical protein DF185_00205 [Marinifilum breve]|uniref:Uncharacterized protein n=2 Tax=Marinifilum breve TaxID=2184082 RepID=A0A2V4A1R3_9BACT|nr:hypothetical protein DF185_00205 [Marinifilum breve]